MLLGVENDGWDQKMPYKMTAWKPESDSYKKQISKKISTKMIQKNWGEG